MSQLLLLIHLLFAIHAVCHITTRVTIYSVAATNTILLFSTLVQLVPASGGGAWSSPERAYARLRPLENPC